MANLALGGPTAVGRRCQPRRSAVSSRSCCCARLQLRAASRLRARQDQLLHPPGPSAARATAIAAVQGEGEDGEWPISDAEVAIARAMVEENRYVECESEYGIIDLATVPPRAEIDEFLAESGLDLRERHRDAAVVLGQLLGTTGPPQLGPAGGTTVWLDLSAFMEWEDWGSETRMFWDLIDQYGVMLMPGGAAGCERAGYFRLHAAGDEDVLGEGLDRLERLLKSRQMLHGNW